MRLALPRLSSVRISRAFGVLWVAVPSCLLLLALAAFGQEEQEPPPAETPASTTLPDTFLSQITSAIQGVTTKDVSALSKCLRIADRSESPASGGLDNMLVPLGDMDGDGVPEMLLKWAIPDVAVAGEVAPAPDSRPLWAVYLLSWDGAHWKASRLLSGVEDLSQVLVRLGAPVGFGLAVLVQDADSQVTYPVIFELKDHVASLLWDAQRDDSRYEPLLQNRVSFQDRPGAPTEMIVTGRAEPGLLRVKPKGRRGFQARTDYHWDGKSFIPAKTEYIADQDYTIYRFISALHLHDFRSAYALVVPAEFLRADSPTLDAFRNFVQDHWPEFLQDAVFEAPEISVGSSDEHVFVLSKPGRRYVYHPVFSTDGKFLLKNLTRTQEAIEP